MPDVSRIGGGGGGGRAQWKEEDRRGRGGEERERMGEHVARVIYFYVSRTLYDLIKRKVVGSGAMRRCPL